LARASVGSGLRQFGRARRGDSGGAEGLPARFGVAAPRLWIGH